MNIKDRLKKLEKMLKKIQPAGGVVVKLKDGKFLHQSSGKTYQTIEEIPGRAFLFVPEPCKDMDEWLEIVENFDFERHTAECKKDFEDVNGKLFDDDND